VQHMLLVGLRIGRRIGALILAEVAIWNLVVMHKTLDQLLSNHSRHRCVMRVVFEVKVAEEKCIYDSGGTIG
jgi:hypothetical protein